MTGDAGRASRTADEKLALADRLLEEAVYRARETQAIGVALSGHALNDPTGPGTCGLGEAAEFRDGLSETGRKLVAELWPELGGDTAVRIKQLLSDWVRRQDAFDRKRNHFLRDFRARNGADRQAYTPELLRAFEGGLDAINTEIIEERRRVALLLLAPGI